MIEIQDNSSQHVIWWIIIAADYWDMAWLLLLFFFNAEKNLTIPKWLKNNYYPAIRRAAESKWKPHSMQQESHTHSPLSLITCMKRWQLVCSNIAQLSTLPTPDSLPSHCGWFLPPKFQHPSAKAVCCTELWWDTWNLTLNYYFFNYYYFLIF